VTRRLSYEAIIHINESVMNFGHALIDRSGLESAVDQPFSTWEGRDLHPTLVEKAAVLLRGIAANHPFQDGNKRTAWIACVELLSLNGAPLDHSRVDPIQAGEMVLSLVKHQIDVKHLAFWLADHLA
jgi:death-on-curing protein